MITRLYVNNFRCLVAFEADFDSFDVICGPNGSGKSSVFDALLIIKNLASGDSTVGGDGVIDVARLEVTNWRNGKADEARHCIQEFEIELTSSGHDFEYHFHFEQTETDQKTRIVHERATCDKRELFDRDQKGVWIKQPGGAKMSFPLDGRIAALGQSSPPTLYRKLKF
jgi:AAA15 family ATPase/GTPase